MNYNDNDNDNDNVEISGLNIWNLNLTDNEVALVYKSCRTLDAPPQPEVPWSAFIHIYRHHYYYYRQAMFSPECKVVLAITEPQDLRVFFTGPRNATITWKRKKDTRPPDGFLFTFQQADDADNVFHVMACGTSNAVTIANLYRGTTYHVTAFGFTGGMAGNKHLNVTLTTEEEVCEGPPINFLVEVANQTAYFSWEPPTLKDCLQGVIRHYRLVIKEESNHSAVTEVLLPDILLQTNVTELKNGVRYLATITTWTRPDLPFGPEANVSFLVGSLASTSSLFPSSTQILTSSSSLTSVFPTSSFQSNHNATSIANSYSINPKPSSSPSRSQSTVACVSSWEGWGEWSTCSRTCGDGVRMRVRMHSPCHLEASESGTASEQETEKCNVQQCTEIDLIVTVNITGETWSDSLLDNSSLEFRELEQKIARNVAEFYGSKNVTNGTTLLSCRKGSVISTFSIKFKKSFSDELLTLQEMMEVNQSISNISLRLLQLSISQMSDLTPPSIASFNELTPDSIQITWNPVTMAIPLLGYIIYYRSSENSTWLSRLCADCTVSTAVEGLATDTEYRFRVQGVTSIGNTLVGPYKLYRTPVIAPIKALPGIRAKPLTSTSVTVEWDPLQPLTAEGGDLVSHKIIAVERDSGEVTQLTTNSWTNWVILRDLKKFTWYYVRVVGLTKDGLGPSNAGVAVQTKEDVPSAPPENLSIRDMLDTSTIIVSWDPVPRPSRNGIIKGYTLSYTATSLKGDKESPIEVDLPADASQVVLDKLSPSSTYRISLSAYTARGGGKSVTATGATCRCPKELQTNWWVIPPYLVTAPGDSEPDGIFGPLVQQMFSEVCGLCMNGHNETFLRFNTSGSGRIAKKKSQLAVIREIDDITDISFPISGRKDDTRYMDKYAYLPLVESPGIVFIVTRGNAGTEKTNTLSASLVACWPVVALFVFMSYIVGAVLWFTEKKGNAVQFPPAFIKGASEGFWFSFVTMTTVGYGDRVPLSNAGRLIAFWWTLIGLVMVSIFTGVITSSLTATAVSLNKEIMLYGTNVSAIANSTEFRVGILKNARMFPFPDMEESFRAVLRGEVKGMLVDAYVASSMQHLFAGQDVYVNRVIDRSLSYGIVLSGQAVRLESACSEYMTTHKEHIVRLIKANVKLLNLDAKSEVFANNTSGAVDKVSDLSGASEARPLVTFEQVLFIVGASFGACVLLGLTWQVYYSIKKKNENHSKIDSDSKKAIIELREMVEEFHGTFVNLSLRLKRERTEHTRCLLKRRKAMGMAWKPLGNTTTSSIL
ncbi:phosphatidylinositol phosphatase PTPRQ [Nematostella vectensis]|uniref:phosphatidylinositol phosphatase PTPRQ n=1 Tax=Nematostella vectensis TaxID=45351 RepID=UPI0020778AE4|nr:phosphatidylinositol phosphatase PTPRQ [Nematostella vectensis]